MLHVALQDGFENDNVIVEVNGKELYSKKDVQTDYRISFTDSFEVDETKKNCSVTIKLPEKGISGTMNINTDETPYLGISVLKGRLQFKKSDHPFGYL